MRRRAQHQRESRWRRARPVHPRRAPATSSAVASESASYAYVIGSAHETQSRHRGHLVARDEQPAEQKLREDERRHELHGLELGAANALSAAGRGPCRARRSRRASTTTSQTRTGDVEPEQPRPRRRDATSACSDRERREGERVPEQQVELAERRASSAARASRSCAPQHRDRRDEEHRRRTGRSRAAAARSRSKTSAAGRRRRTRSSVEQHAGHDEHAARACAGRGAAGAGCARRSRSVIACSPRPPSDRAWNASSESPLGPSSGAPQLVRRTSRDDRDPRACSSSRSHRTASSMTWLETSTVGPVVRERVEQVPQVAPQHRVEPHRRLVEHEHLGLAEQRAGERTRERCAAREVPRPGARASAEVDRAIASVDGSATDADDPRDVARGSRAP